MSKTSKAKKQTFKCIACGDGRTGKTSICRRWLEDTFDPDSVSTQDAQMHVKKSLYVDGTHHIALNIWDTAGQERYSALGPLYYRGADGALVVFDVTDEATFDRCRRWIKELHKAANPEIQIVICGNKCDMVRDRAISDAKAESFAKKVGAKYFPTSAKDNINIDEAFMHLARSVLSVATGKSNAAASVLDNIDNDDLFGDVLGDGGKSKKKNKTNKMMIIDDTDEQQEQQGNETTSVNPFANSDAAAGTIGHDNREIGQKKKKNKSLESGGGDGDGDDWKPSSYDYETDASGGGRMKIKNDDDDEDEDDNNNQDSLYDDYGVSGSSGKNSNSKKKNNNKPKQAGSRNDNDDDDDNADYAIEQDGFYTSSATKTISSDDNNKKPATTQQQQQQSQAATRHEPAPERLVVKLGDAKNQNSSAGAAKEEKKCSC